MLNIANGLVFQVHGTADHGGVSEGLNEVLVFLGSLAGQSGVDVFKLLLPGVAAMVNIHPLLVHFPIALLTMFFLVELGALLFKQPQWRSIASGLLYLGTLCAALAVYFGFQAAATVAHDETVHAIMEKHEGFGIAILSLAVFLSVWRWFFNVHKNAGVQVVYLLFAAVLNLLVVLGADLGGLMVYYHGVSVNANAPAASAVSEDGHGHSHEHGGHHH